MTLLESVVNSPLAGAIGWSLVHSLWQGAIVAAVLGAVLLATRSARIRYAAACLALLVLLGGFTVTMIRLMPGESLILQPVRVAASSTPNVGAGQNSKTAVHDIDALAPWLTPFWVAGVLLFCLRDAAGFLALQRMRRRGVCEPSGVWREELARLKARVRVSKPVVLLESSLAEVPMVIGHLGPLILMPVGLMAGLPAGQVEAILLHELAHIRRHDYLMNVLQRLVESLLFYHPAAWWISRVIRAEREHCCDDVVVSIRGDAHEYAVALAALEGNRWSGREPAVAAIGGSLVTRIQRLLYPGRSNGAWTPFFAAVVLIAAASMTLAAWQADPQRQGAGKSAAWAYELWVTQDVVYIILDEERAAFQRLTSDEERQHFIEQFWLRRDPTPGTPANEMKEEHYRRIGYVNQRFATNAKEGWRTDRGRIYIQWGPPDEIESHPSGGPNTPPYEIWRYRHVEGIGNDLFITFRDRSRTGDYQTAPGNVR